MFLLCCGAKKSARDKARYKPVYVEDLSGRSTGKDGEDPTEISDIAESASPTTTTFDVDIAESAMLLGARSSAEVASPMPLRKPQGQVPYRLRKQEILIAPRPGTSKANALTSAKQLGAFRAQSGDDKGVTFPAKFIGPTINTARQGICKYCAGKYSLQRLKHHEGVCSRIATITSKYITCAGCNRRFNKRIAESHIPFCVGKRKQVTNNTLKKLSKVTKYKVEDKHNLGRYKKEMCKIGGGDAPRIFRGKYKEDVRNFGGGDVPQFVRACEEDVVCLLDKKSLKLRLAKNKKAQVTAPNRKSGKVEVPMSARCKNEVTKANGVWNIVGGDNPCHIWSINENVVCVFDKNAMKFPGSHFPKNPKNSAQSKNLSQVLQGKSHETPKVTKLTDLKLPKPANFKDQRK